MVNVHLHQVSPLFNRVSQLFNRVAQLFNRVWLAKWAGLAAVLWLVSTTASAKPAHQDVATLNIAEFVALALSESFAALQYDQQTHSQTLALKAAQNRHLPQVSLVTEVGKERKNTIGTAYQDHYQEGIDGGVSIDWRLPTGAQFNTRYQQEYGRALGLEALGTNKDYQRTEVTSAEITQPLFQTHPIDQEYLPVEAARLQWAAYQAQGQLLELEGVRDALLGFIDYQQMVDTVALYQQAVAYSDYRVQVAQNLLLAGRVTPSEVASAKVDWQQRKVQLVRVQGDKKLLLGRLGAVLQVDYWVALTPLKNMSLLTQCLIAGQGQTTGTALHPQITQASASVSRLQKQYQLTRYDLWPTLDLFYRYKGTHSSTVQDAIERSVGVAFSYSPTQWQTEASQAISRSTWLEARYGLDATRKALENEGRLRQQQQQQLQQQLQLATQLVELAQEAYRQQLLRFEEGVASAASVKDAQNQLQEAQLSLLGDQTQWLKNRMHWNYAQNSRMNVMACVF